MPYAFTPAQRRTFAGPNREKQRQQRRAADRAKTRLHVTGGGDIGMVAPEERGPRTSAEDGLSGATVKCFTKSLPISVHKIDTENRQLFGFASMSTVNGKDVEDLQNEIVPIEVIERAAYEYMQKSRDVSDAHKQRGVATCIESMVFTKAKQQALKIDLGCEGWWIGLQFPEGSPVWKKLRDGTARPSFSIGGSGITREVLT
jgi:hypothetical protein